MTCSVIGFARSPAEIVARAEMKRALVSNLSSPDTVQLYVMGSTLFDVTRGTRNYPFSGRRSGDLDIGVTHKSPSTAPGQNGRTIDKASVGEALWQAILASGFEAMTPEGDPVSNSASLAGKFVAARNFTQEEIRDLLQQRFDDAETALPSGGMRVLLEVDVNDTSQMTVLLPPASLNAARLQNQSQLKADDARHFLAKLVARSVRHNDFRSDGGATSFSPSDLISIYNAVKADPPILNLDAQSARSDVKLLRLLMLVNFALLNPRIEDIDLNSFDPTPRNIDLFRKSLDGVIHPASHLTDERITEILTTFQETVRKIFPTSPSRSNRKTPLHLTRNELEFFELLQGYRTLPAGGREYPPPDPAIRVQLLDIEYGSIFKRYPHLRDNILNAPGLIQMGREILERRSGF